MSRLSRAVFGLAIAASAYVAADEPIMWIVVVLYICGLVFDD